MKPIALQQSDQSTDRTASGIQTKERNKFTFNV